MAFKEPVICLSQSKNAVSLGQSIAFKDTGTCQGQTNSAVGQAQSIAFKDTVTCLSQTNEVVCPGHDLESCGHLSQSDQQQKIRSPAGVRPTRLCTQGMALKDAVTCLSETNTVMHAPRALPLKMQSPV